MADRLLDGVILLAVLGSGLIAGVFFAFSAFVMRALARLPVPQGAAAMQSINIVVLNPLFLGVFFGTGVLCVLLVVLSLAGWSHPRAAWLLVGGILYLLGTLGVTMVCNVPRNNALDVVDPGSAEGETVWRRYVIEWTWWNHVRSAAALAAAASFSVAFRLAFK